MISTSKITVATVSVTPNLSEKDLICNTEKSLRDGTHRRRPQCLNCKVDGYKSDPDNLCPVIQPLSRRDRALLKCSFVFRF
jgi:hypothetical protein